MFLWLPCGHVGGCPRFGVCIVFVTYVVQKEAGCCPETLVSTYENTPCHKQEDHIW